MVNGLNGQVLEGLEQPIQIKFANPPGGGKGGGSWDGGKGDKGGKGGKGGKDRYSPYGGYNGSKGGKGGGDNYGMIKIIEAVEGSGMMPGGHKWQNDENTLYVAGLPPDCSDYHLWRLFSPFGPICPNGVKAMMDKEGAGTCTGIAFVNYQEHSAAQTAIATLNGGQMADGSYLKVEIKKPPMAGEKGGKGKDGKGGKGGGKGGKWGGKMALGGGEDWEAGGGGYGGKASKWDVASGEAEG